MPAVRWAPLWSVATAVGLIGLYFVALGGAYVGCAFWALGMGTLAIRSVFHAGRRAFAAESLANIARLVFGSLGLAITLATGILLDVAVRGDDRVDLMVFGALGTQLWLAGLGFDPVRREVRYPRLILPFLGHGLVLVGSLSALARPDAFVATAGMIWAAGFSLLFLHAYWTERTWARSNAAVGPRGWEPWLLILMALGALTFYANAFAPIDRLTTGPPRVVELLSRCAIVIGAAVLADRPLAPRLLRGRARWHYLPEAFASLVFVNLLAAAFLVAAPWHGSIYLAVLSTWVLLTILFEYWTILHHVRKRLGRGARPTPPRFRGAIDAIVNAHNEEHILPLTLAHNLRVAPNVRFLIVLSRHSADGTAEVARRLARKHPRRVRVVQGPNGSKAEDLEAAWPLTKTSLVLVLDADETLRPRTLDTAVAFLDAHPDVGVYQCRKVPRDPSATAFSRFLASERRFNTILDHPLHADVFGTAHFSGSAAVLRRSVPADAGGWNARILTEDIDLSLRIVTRTPWRIHYDPDLLVDESTPANLRELIRQRTRWGRGWNQCFVEHLRPILAAKGPGAVRRKFGYLWQYLNSFSAAWAVLVPTLGFLWMTGRTSFLPFSVSLGMLALTLPTRAWSFLYANWQESDPVWRPRFGVREAAEAVFHAYAWLLFGWLVQLRCLYLELSEAPRAWYATEKAVGHARLDASARRRMEDAASRTNRPLATKRRRTPVA